MAVFARGLAAAAPSAAPLCAGADAWRRPVRVSHLPCGDPLAPASLPPPSPCMRAYAQPAARVFAFTKNKKTTTNQYLTTAMGWHLENELIF